MKTHLPIVVAVLFAVVQVPSPAAGAQPARPDRNLGDLTLEELMNETVTSVSKREQKLSDAAAAITVLSNDDIRRSGVTSLADALRLVPGMDVAAVNASQTAVSARGFNSLFANKLLVLVDGRAVYSPLFSGVSWDLQQTMLEDVDRIEVIRGPGATVWGANAVNGVINVITRSAKETQGGLLYGGGGNVQRAMAGARVGGRAGAHTYYRVFASYEATADSPLGNGEPAHDNWRAWHGGFRFDRYAPADTHLVWQADATVLKLTDSTSDAYNANMLGRWTRTLTGRSSAELQAYVDRTHRDEVGSASNRITTLDISAQHTFGWGERHDVIWGAGYRFSGIRIAERTPAIRVRDGVFNQQMFSAFVQDEYQLVPERLTLSAGAKVEHNDLTGFEIQPSIRAVFNPAENQTVWAAVSRALRTPSALEGRDVFAIGFGGPAPGPGGGLFLPVLVGNRQLDSEVLWAYELGYRIQPHRRLSLELAVYYHRYRDLILFADPGRIMPGVPFGVIELPWSNLLSAETYGGGGSVKLTPTEAWRLTATYTLLVAQVWGPANADSAGAEGSSPRHKFILRSAHDLTKRASFDAQLRCVGKIQLAPAYTTADVRLSYRLTDQLELALVGQNLLERRHPEQVAPLLAVNAEVPRGFYGKFTWRF